jgi:hypothetical protein
MRQNEEEVEAINKNAFRGPEEKKQSMWTIWRKGEENHTSVNSLKKIVMGIRVLAFWAVEGQI